ncbi:sugar phosphate isomerase/epimerase family protein [Pararhodonellum marinum]|uniref:sugar phosphate isomerase/epimerase family protein n=1 Tax=Pararhodonellum marinum TaxID=2755358 RepID=UPI001E547438|nr:sugar phosphate isomerase/epimerase [Pararhodonellum marinum]
MMIKQLTFSVLAFLLFFGNTAAQTLLFPDTPGMVSYTYRNSFQQDVAATLDTLQAMGIKDMEFSNLFGKSAAELRAMLDERGMYCSSFGVSYQDLMNKTDQVGKDANILGAKYVRVAWIPHDTPFDLAAAEKAIADFNMAGKILKDKFDLVFCYHNHGYEFHPHEVGTLFDLMIQKTDPNYVSFEMDILWTFFPGADPVYYLEKYGDRFKLMHLKDLKKGVDGNLSGGTPVKNDVALGTGQLDIPAILIAAKKANVKHYYIEDESPTYYKQVPQSMEYLKSLKK